MFVPNHVKAMCLQCPYHGARSALQLHTDEPILSFVPNLRVRLDQIESKEVGKSQSCSIFSKKYSNLLCL